MALLLFLILPLAYSAGQEKIAFNYPHDDYYFLLRSDDYNLHGNHLAYIREYLYPLFICLARTLGLGLHNTEVICFGLALFWLWRETISFSKSRWIGWLTVLPMVFFTYQHEVFNRVTYDTLQLILTPLSIASILYLCNRSGQVLSLVIAGLITGLHALTRPEGWIYLVPPVLILWIWCRQNRITFLRCMGKTAILVLVPLLLYHSVSGLNYMRHGFWAPTIIKSKPFQDSLLALMSIDPQNNTPDPYASLPISSMQKAFEVSPAFRATKHFFSDNLNGAGWSGFSHYNYQTIDGSIAGGHTQWAWFEAVASVAGSKAEEMLAYHRLVAQELNEGFESGRLPKRKVWTTAFGAEFSPLSPAFHKSLFNLLPEFLHFNTPILPRRASRASNERVERDYDWLALRRKGLVDDQHWQKLGWLAIPSLGIPEDVYLDEEAVRSQIVLQRLNRPDVAQAILPEGTPIPEEANAGFLLIIRGNASGNMVVKYPNQEVAIPIQNLRYIQANRTYTHEGVNVRIDDDYGNSGFAHEMDRTIFGISTFISQFMHYFMRVAISLSLLFLVLQFLPRFRVIVAAQRPAFVIVSVATLSLFLLRWGLLAALDAGITPGNEPRYMASGAFNLWFFTTFLIACLLYSLVTRYRQRTATN